MGIVYAVLASVLLALANVILKRSFKYFPPSVSFFIFSLITLFSWLPVGLMLGVTFELLFLSILVGFVSALLGQAVYIYVLSKGELSITATILSTFSIYTIVFSLLFNHERLSTGASLFIFLAIIGTVIVTLPPRFNRKEFKKLSLIGWALVGAASVGASDTATKYIITATSVGSFLFFVSLAQVVVSLIILRADKQSLSQFKTFFFRLPEYKYALIGSAMIAASTLFLFLGFNLALASIVSPIMASFPVFTVLLSMAFLKEKLSMKNLAGIILVCIAILGIGFFET